MPQLDFLSPVRVKRVMQGVYDPRLMPQPLIWDKRIPTVPAADSEILARFEGFPMIADLIALDAQAVVYSFGKFQFYTTKAPKLKLGIGLNETMLSLLDRLTLNVATEDDIGLFRNWEQRLISTVRYGVDIRREALLISMLFDGLAYNRMGIIISGATWGMFSDLKVTVGTSWDQTTATPVADMLLVKLTAQVRYGVTFDRVTMSTTAFRNMTNTTEFQNKARMYLAPNVSFTNLNISDIGMLKNLAQNVINMSIELDDRRFWSQGTDGVTTSSPLWPTAGVVLSSSSFDGNSMAWDFANGRLVEKIVADAAGGAAPAVADMYGPTVYPTLSNPQLNAPGFSYWCSQYGFPRKHMRQVNAALTVGTFSDSISTALPF